jgi:hypothetical protein
VRTMRRVIDPRTMGVVFMKRMSRVKGPKGA